MMASSVSPERWLMTLCSRATRQLDRLERLGERADLVHLDQDRVGDLLLDAALQALGVGHK